MSARTSQKQRIRAGPAANAPRLLQQIRQFHLYNAGVTLPALSPHPPPYVHSFIHAQPITRQTYSLGGSGLTKPSSEYAPDVEGRETRAEVDGPPITGVQLS